MNKIVFFVHFRIFLDLSKCMALGNFIITLIEIIILRFVCMGGISKNRFFETGFRFSIYSTIAS